MTYTIFGITFYSKRDRERLSPTEYEFLECHEAEHRKRPIEPASQRAERRVQKKAIEKMMKKGYSFNKLLTLEFSTRLYYKYGLRLEEYKKYMRGESKCQEEMNLSRKNEIPISKRGE